VGYSDGALLLLKRISLRCKGPMSKPSPLFNTSGSPSPRTPLGKMQLQFLTRWECDQITFSLAVNFLVCLFNVVRLSGLALVAKGGAFTT